jgi:hypothetical protein
MIARHFLRDPNARRIKIGYSGDVEQRVKAIRLMSSAVLELLGQVPAPRWFERVLHRVFSGLREHGEWFRESAELLQFIQQTVSIRKT